MKIAIYDLETSSFYANNGIVLCAVVKEYGKNIHRVFRADKYKNWKYEKSNNSFLIKDLIEYLDTFDIVVAHNGEHFDKTFLNTKCIKYGFKPILRLKKSIDPVLSARRHLKMGRNSLASLIDYFDIEYHKTPIEFAHWIKASHDSNSKSMDIIVKHCVMDVKSLEKVYDKLRPLIDKIDNKGSSY